MLLIEYLLAVFCGIIDHLRSFYRNLSLQREHIERMHQGMLTYLTLVSIVSTLFRQDFQGGWNIDFIIGLYY
jgi:hypothetical protein